MACTPQRSERIAELVGRRLDAAATSELLEHVESCSECSRELDLVADLLHAPALQAVPAAATPRRFALRRVLAAGGLAAAVLLFLFLPTREEGSTEGCQRLARLAPPHVAEVLLRGESGGDVSGSQAAARFSEAMQGFASGDYASAIPMLEGCTREQPSNALAFFYLGLARLQLGDREQDALALEALRKAQDLGEGLLAEQALWYRANAHLARGEGEAARLLLLEVIERDGDFEPNARTLLAELEALLAR